MANDQVVVGSSRGSAEGRSSEETLVGRPEAGPLPQKQGEIGWVPPQETPAEPQQVATQPDNQLPARHPADRSTPLPPTPTAPTTNHPNTSTTSLQSRSSAFKQFLRTPRPLPTIHGVRSATILRVALLTFTLIGSIVGWVVTVTKMNHWNKQDSAFINQSPPPDASGNSMTPTSSLDQMTSSSLVFVHVAFGAAILFQLLMLERAVYRFRAERYAFLHPDEMAAMAHGNSVMGLAPWNRPPLPTYAAALGVRGTGDVEDNMIAVPPPPEYGNTRGSTLLLAAHLPPNLTRPRSSQGTGRPTSQGTVRDALGRPAEAWSRPVSYGEDELRQNVRRSMDLETALARLEGPASRPGSSTSVRRPENAVVRT